MSIAETYAKLKQRAYILYPSAYDACLVREGDIVDTIGEDGLKLMLEHHLIVPYGDANNHQLYLLGA